MVDGYEETYKKVLSIKQPLHKIFFFKDKVLCYNVNIPKIRCFCGIIKFKYCLNLK